MIDPNTDGAATADGARPKGGRWRRWLEWSWIVTVVVFTLVRLVVARETLAQYGLNIWIFGVVDLVTAVPYALGTAKVVEAMVDRDGRSLGRWAAVAGASFIAPYLYIAWAGTGGAFPVEVYVVLGILVLVFGANALWSIIRKVRVARTERAAAQLVDAELSAAAPAPASAPAGPASALTNPARS